MAPTKKSMNVTAMLKKKGFNPKEHDVDTVLDVEGVEYVVKMNNGKKVFELFNAELEKEEYDEREPEQPEKADEAREHDEEKGVIEEDYEEGWTEEPEEPEEPVIVEAQPEKNAKKVLLEHDDEAEEPEEPVVAEEAKPPKKAKATKKAQAEQPEVPNAPKAKKVSKKDNDEKKPRKTRSPTAYNKFIQEKMFEFKETEPDMIGTARFAKATQAWKNLDKATKDKYTADFKANIAEA